MNSALVRTTLRRPTEVAGAVVDLDVTPVMNMFIILIPFLVSMAVFSHLAVHSFSLPADEGPGEAKTADELPLTVALAADRIVVARGEWTLGEAARGESSYDWNALVTALESARVRLPQVDDVVVAVDDAVVCADVVGALDRCREAGYGEVGLAAGTNLDREGDTP